MSEEKCRGTRGGWIKYPGSPVLGGELGTCFDVSVLREGNGFRMFFSWRPKKSVAVTVSADGVHWSEPEICIGPRETAEGWENGLNRPSVVRRGTIYHMWYTGQLQLGRDNGTSQIFHAVSEDGVHFTRTGDRPVLDHDCPWENQSVMNPTVIYDEDAGLYRMWYSAGSQYEPRAIGYAESRDGLVWNKYAGNPVFECEPSRSWEQHKVAGCQVIRRAHDFLMFYIGYFNEDYAQIGMARSRDGVSGWERYENNPIVAPTEGAWDGEACYKPFAMEVDGRWMLWYNGRTGSSEQIGLVTREGALLDF